MRWPVQSAVSTKPQVTIRPSTDQDVQLHKLFAVVKTQVEKMEWRRFSYAFLKTTVKFLKVKRSTQEGIEFINKFMSSEEVQSILDAEDLMWSVLDPSVAIPAEFPPDAYDTRIALAVTANLNPQQKKKLANLLGDTTAAGLLNALKADATQLLGTHTVQDVRRAGRESALAAGDLLREAMMDYIDREWCLDTYEDCPCGRKMQSCEYCSVITCETMRVH
jgi:hypothetical protein